MVQDGKTGNMIKEFNRYELVIMRLIEERWTGFDELMTTSGETVLYTGAEEHHRGPYPADQVDKA